MTLVEIKCRLLELKRGGKLDRVRLLLLTNITFNGIFYDPARIMEEVLTIKPDMIFLWDEAGVVTRGLHQHCDAVPDVVRHLLAEAIRQR